MIHPPSIHGDIIAPAWFVFLTRPQRESAAAAWLGARGVETWFPTETAWRNSTRQGKRTRTPYEKRILPGYVFARFEAMPQMAHIRWVWNGNAWAQNRFISGVIGHNNSPAAISDADMMKMTALPKRLEQIRQQEQMRRTIVPHAKARITDGSMAGWVVEVEAVHAGLARFIVPLLGEARAEMPVERMERVWDDKSEV